VRLVIWGIEIHAVPAGWEEDLSAEAVRAVVVWDLVSLRLATTEAVEVDGALLEGWGE
jgi:hypothetical protein